LTQPTPYPQPPDDEMIAFETAAVAVVTGAVAAAVAGVFAAALSAFLAGATGTALGAALATRLRWVRWSPMAPALRRVEREARALGKARALPYASLDDLPPLSLVGAGEPLPLPDPDRAVSMALGEAVRLAESLPMTRKADIMSVQGRANQGLSTARGHARWTANAGVNAGAVDVARAAGLRLVWVSERDSCLHCLAHAGYAVEPGEPFPIVSYDPIRPGAMPAVPHPPLHPNCRCQVRPYSGPAGRPPTARDAIDPAARLAAEARRSVVYQWSDYASGVRLRAAAARLLDAGAALPTSVERRAARALARGIIVNKPTK
jgi:hypothetical protein